MGVILAGTIVAAGAATAAAPQCKPTGQYCQPTGQSGHNSRGHHVQGAGQLGSDQGSRGGHGGDH